MLASACVPHNLSSSVISNCGVQIRNFQFAQSIINCAKHCAICKLHVPTRGVREWGKRMLVVKHWRVGRARKSLEG